MRITEDYWGEAKKLLHCHAPQTLRLSLLHAPAWVSAAGVTMAEDVACLCRVSAQNDVEL